MIKRRTNECSFKNINNQYESGYKQINGKNSTSKITLESNYLYSFTLKNELITFFNFLF